MNQKTNLDVKQDVKIKVEQKFEIKLPKNYQVLLHNNHATAFEVVMLSLQQIFNKRGHDATQIMMTAHNTGLAQVAIYPKDIAEQKIKEFYEYRLKLIEEYPDGYADILEYTCEPMDD